MYRKCVAAQVRCGCGSGGGVDGVWRQMYLNLRHVWEERARVGFTCSSIHLAVGVFGFMGAVERVASRIYL
jgi:hypothetical protein